MIRPRNQGNLLYEKNQWNSTVISYRINQTGDDAAGLTISGTDAQPGAEWTKAMRNNNVLSQVW